MENFFFMRKMQTTVKEFRGILRRPPRTRRLFVAKTAKNLLKMTLLKGFCPVFKAEFRSIPQQKRQMAVSEQKVPNQQFLAKMAKKLPKIAKHQCCRIFRLDTGNSEAKTRILTKGPKIFHCMRVLALQGLLRQRSTTSLECSQRAGFYLCWHLPSLLQL